MSIRTSLAAAVLAVTTACAQLVPEQIVNEAAAALGGRERVLTVRSLSFEGAGTQFNLGQDRLPEAQGQTYSVSSLTRRLDIAAGRSRTELTRTPNFAHFQGQAPQRQVQGVDGAVAYNVGASGNATRAANTVAHERRADLYHHPITAVRAALASGATLANARMQGSERLIDVSTENGLRFVLGVDGSGLPSRVESRSYHANLGDVTLSTLFADYQDVAGLKVPTRVTTKVDDYTTADVRFPKCRVDIDVADLAAPSAAAGAAPVGGPPPPNVVTERVAPGIWLLAGQSHHSVLAELSDHLMLIDAPQSEARTLAVIAKARELRPGKPLTKVVTSHHHFDHTAGIRAAIAEGLSVVTHSGNRAFFEDMARRPHTIVADALAKNPKPLNVETVDESLVIQDAARTVGIYHVTGNPHSDTMLMIHFPGERVLVQVDAFSPGAPVNPYAANLLDNITKRNLRVDRIVPLHGAIVPFDELVRAQGK